MSSRPNQELVKKTAAVARMAPAEWAEFIDEFKKYAEERRDACIMAPSDAVRLAQGHAQICDALSELFEHAVKAADRNAGRRS